MLRAGPCGRDARWAGQFFAICLPIGINRFLSENFVLRIIASPPRRLRRSTQLMGQSRPEKHSVPPLTRPPPRSSQDRAAGLALPPDAPTMPRHVRGPR